MASATADRDSVTALLSRALVAAALAEAAVVAASLIPIIGTALIPMLTTAAAAAAYYVTFLLGQLAGAAALLGTQLKGLGEAVDLENAALLLVQSSCPADTAKTCVDALPPCP